MKPSVTLWAYPWDIARVGILATVKRLVEARVSDMSVATVYHSGQVLSLATGEPYFVAKPLGPLFDWRLGGPGVPDGPQFFRDLRDALTEAHIGLRGWTIVGHDQLGWSPMINVFGQEMSHAPCPVANRTRILQLVQDLAELEVFQALDIEALGFIRAFHGAHHEISGVAISPLINLLLSICFCPACAESFGTDLHWDGLRETVKHDLTLLLQQDLVTADPMAEVATFLVDHPEMASFFKLRGRYLEGMVEEGTEHIPLAVISGQHDNQAHLGWLQGVTASAGGHHDLLALGYGSPAVLANDLQWLFRKGWATDRLIVGQTLVASAVSSLDEAKGRLRVALELGIRRFSFYNFGLLPPPRRPWLSALADMVWEA